MSDAQSAYDGFISYSHAADDQLAPRLQAGLQRFAKPWWQRRALRIFRDESSLAANPHLWSSITEALDEAGWFVLLLSPDAAQSGWVNQEIVYWLEHKATDRIIPVVTAGEFGWDGSDVTGDCVPGALRGVFESEPRWVDARELGDPEALDLQNPEFAAVVADLAAPLRGVPKDELAGEEVRQHKRTVRTAWAAGVAVLVLAVAAAGFGLQASNSAAEAERQAEIAAANAADADTQRVAAEDNASEAERQAGIAEDRAEAEAEARQLARARELAASSVNAAEEDPQLALALAIQGVDLLPDGADVGPALETALRGAMSEGRLLGRYEELAAASPTGLDVSPDGSLAALSVLASATLHVLDTETLESIWTYDEDTADSFEHVAFSSDGSYLVLSITDERYSRHGSFAGQGEPTGEPDARFVVLDARDGQLVHTEVVPGACDLAVFPGGWREDLGLLGFGFTGCGSDGEFEGTIRFLDTETWTVVYEREAADFPHVVFGGDGVLAAVLSGPTSEPDSAIIDTSTWVVVRDLEVPWGALSGDASLFAADTGIGVRLEAADSGELVDRLPTGSLFVGSLRFSDRGELVLPFIGDETAVVDVESGAEVSRIKTGATDGGAVLRSGRLYTATNGVLSVWDQAGVLQGDLDTVPLGLWVNANSIFQAEGTAFANVYDFATDKWAFYPVDPSGALGTPVDATDFWEWTPIPDNRVVIQRAEETAAGPLAGPIEVLDLTTGESEVVAGCWLPMQEAVGHDPCPDGSSHPWGIIGSVGSRAGDEMLIFDEVEPGEPRDTWVSIWDTDSMTESARLNLGLLSAWGNQLRESALTDDYLLLYNRREGTLEVLDRETLEPQDVQGPTESIAKLEHDPVQNAMWMTDFDDKVLRLDLDRMVVESISGDAAPGFVRGLAASPTGDRIAVGSTDGALRIFSTEGELLHLIPLPNPSDAYWLDDLHLAVGTANGPWTVITLDPDELAEVARSRLRRSFTSTECQFYGVDPCPTLEEMRSP